ncbi:MAG: hypothetical protein QOI31_1740 [Solirubrobacterales bacterium]|jgi:hypothetical protein|nr:hypothetical protein [Solirubrobacterales bacterium]
MDSSKKPAPSDDVLAGRALQRMVANLVDRLHDAIEEGLDAETLHDIAGLWEANNLNEDLTYEQLVADGAPTTCDDCGSDVTPYDETGRPVEGGWEWFMVSDEVWETASRGESAPGILCIGCLEKRIGRRLEPTDFPELAVNKSGWIVSDQLMDRLGQQ